MEIGQLLQSLEELVVDPCRGLPEEVFLFISRITPLVNVDLLIKNSESETLLTWRDDGYNPPGWHVPGGIVRFKETFADRLHAVAAGELGAKIEFKDVPLAVNERIHPTRATLGHHVSLLYQCKLLGTPDPSRQYKGGHPRAGEWAWHGTCPADLIPIQHIYRQFIGSR